MTHWRSLFLPESPLLRLVIFCTHHSDVGNFFSNSLLFSFIIDSIKVPVRERTQANMNEAVSYAALRIIQNLIPDQATQTKETLKIFRSMGYDPNFYAQDSSPAGIGNKIAAEIIAARADDGFNQYGTYPTTMIGTANYSGELIFFFDES